MMRWNRTRRLVLAGALAATLTLLAGEASAGPKRTTLTTITVDTLPIANALPLDLGIAKGFFSSRGIEIKKQILQSGNDIVLALANHNGEIGYLGYTPMMIARTQNIPITLLAASEVEGTSTADNWQNVLVKGNSSIRSPADLAGKTIAVNALKGVSEVVIKGALQKLGVDPNSVKLLAIPFPTMRTALNNGQVDAIHVPEPFLSQGLGIDGDRIVLAPGPALGNYWPNGGYAALSDWMKTNPELAKNFRLAMNESVEYAQSHPDEIRALLPPGTQNVRLPIWTSSIDRTQLLALAKAAKQFGVIASLPNFTQLFPSDIRSGFATGLLEASVGKKVVLKQAGKVPSRLDPGKYLLIVKDTSKTAGFRLTGPGVAASTGVRKTGIARVTITLQAGRYVYTSVGGGKTSRGSFSVS
jgi:NitT/TauT family transport system substrate-binding protein